MSVTLVPIGARVDIRKRKGRKKMRYCVVASLSDGQESQDDKLGAQDAEEGDERIDCRVGHERRIVVAFAIGIGQSGSIGVSSADEAENSKVVDLIFYARECGYYD